MSKTKKVADLINESGKSHCYYADRLGLSEQCFGNRCTGRTDWTLSEAVTLAKELGISLEDMAEVIKKENRR